MTEHTPRTEFAGLVASRLISDLAERHADRVWRAIVDTFVAHVAARNSPDSTVLRRYVEPVAGSGRSTDWSGEGRYPSEPAAMLNASIAHLLDYDDVCTTMRIHPSVVLLPAIISLGEEIEATGREIAEAYAAGYEVMVRLVGAVRDPLFGRGWHGTSTAGIVGSTAACARLLGLSVDKTGHAVALAVAHASGTRQSFGSLAKAIQVGGASSGGVKAARLAQAGAMGGTEPFIGEPGGFSSTYAGVPGENLLGRLQVDKPAMDAYPEEPKRFPSCLATHAAIECVLELADARVVDIGDVEYIQVVTNPTGLAAVPYSTPRNPLEAKFSMEYNVAAALVDGGVGLASFEDDMILRPDVRDLMKRIACREAERNGQGRWTSVRVRTRDWEAETTGQYRIEFEPADALDARLKQKVVDCLSFLGRPADVSWLFGERTGWLERPISELMARLRDLCQD